MEESAVENIAEDAVASEPTQVVEGAKGAGEANEVDKPDTGHPYFEATLTTVDLSGRCVYGTHPSYGVYIQAIQSRKGSLYPHTGSSWSSHGERGPGFCHNPDAPIILPVWEWMHEAGFTEEQMQEVQQFLEKHEVVQTPVGKSNVSEVNF